MMDLPASARSYRKDGGVDIRRLLRPVTDVERIYENLFGGSVMPAWHREFMILATKRHIALMDPKIREPGLWVNGKQVLKF